MASRGQALAAARRSFFGASLLGLRKVLIVLACLSLLTILALLIYEPKRSFLLEAQTRSIELTFLPGPNTWRFPEAVVCRPLQVPSRIPDPDCGLAFEAVHESAGEWIMAWDPDMRIRMIAGVGGYIRLEVLASSREDLPVGSAILINQADVPEIGALTFAASAALGREMTTGSQSYLLSGRWEAREEGFVIAGFRSITEVVKAGSLSLGTQVEILNNGFTARSYGHLVPIIGPENGIVFHVNILSEAGDTALSVRHFGLDRPVIIEPDWMDVTLSSPLILSIGVLLAMLAAASQILSDAPSFTGTRQKSADAESEDPAVVIEDHNPKEDIN